MGLAIVKKIRSVCDVTRVASYVPNNQFTYLCLIMYRMQFFKRSLFAAEGFVEENATIFAILHMRCFRSDVIPVFFTCAAFSRASVRERSPTDQ